MMSKKSPQLRFEGFTDDWEERKLGEYVNFLNGRAYKQSELLDKGKYKVVRVGNFNTNDRWYYSDLELDQNKYAQKGDLLYLWATNFGPEIWSEEKVIYHYHIWKLELLNNNLDKQYLYTWLVTDKERIKQNTNGTTMVHVTKGNMEQRDFQFPGLNEQQKIGSFFKQLDDTIALHQRKLDLLKEQKKGYLQKMFPKNGAKVPELRFAGFADDWEERKLSDVANHRGGTAIEKYFDKDGVYKVISIGSYGLNSQYVDQNIRAISNEITDGRVVNSGELTMVLNDKTANGTIIGRTLLVEKDNEYVINQRTEIISPKENFDSNFAYTTLNGPFREKVKRIVQGGTQIYVNYPAVSNLNLELPKIEEQQKIGSFFKQLDDTIALHQRKLDLLKEQKKGFLQKMFV